MRSPQARRLPAALRWKASSQIKLPDCAQNASPTPTGADYGNSAQIETRYPIHVHRANSHLS